MLSLVETIAVSFISIIFPFLGLAGVSNTLRLRRKIDEECNFSPINNRFWNMVKRVSGYIFVLMYLIFSLGFLVIGIICFGILLSRALFLEATPALILTGIYFLLWIAAGIIFRNWLRPMYHNTFRFLSFVYPHSRNILRAPKDQTNTTNARNRQTQDKK